MKFEQPIENDDLNKENIPEEKDFKKLSEEEIEQIVTEEREALKGPWFSEETNGQHFDNFTAPMIRDLLQRGFPNLPKKELFELLPTLSISLDKKAIEELLKEDLSKEELFNLIPYSKGETRRDIINKLLSHHQPLEKKLLQDLLEDVRFSEELSDVKTKIENLLSD